MSKVKTFFIESQLEECSSYVLNNLVCISLDIPLKKDSYNKKKGVSDQLCSP